ncbi:DUF4817 domain-containing protein [Trichonephila clavipes]|nr:DUF4817 domain-containing protein [Trichonephila clavipes]
MKVQSENGAFSLSTEEEKSGRPSIATDKLVAKVDEEIRENRRIRSVCPSTLWKILRKDLGLRVYKIQLVKELKPNDHQARRRFVEWAQNEIAVVPDFHKRIFFSDEAHFWLNGYVNKQNCRIWSEANPQVYVETPLHSEKLIVWCALWADGIIGAAVPTRRRNMSHSSCHNRFIERPIYLLGDRLISRFGPVNWPPKSCDLTPLDYFLWSYVKSLVYADKPETLDHLEDNIRRVIADIRPQMLEKVIENWTTSEPAVAVLCQKSYSKCNATRLSFE